MIEPENNEMSGKVSLIIEENHQPIQIRKRKRRWIYYGLCVLISFIISRIVLIVFSIANFNLKDYAFNQLNYNSEKARSIYVEAIHCNAYSPLNAQILEGVVSFYSNSKESKTRELMAELHVPLIHIEKYKNLQFKGNVVWKNVRPKVIWRFRKKKSDLSIFFTGNVWFRFCYIKFWKSHSDEVTLSYPFGTEENNQSNFPIHVKQIESKNLPDCVQFDVELEVNDFKVPTYLNVCLDNVSFNFGGDFPCRMTLFSQEISNGNILNSIMLRFIFEKEHSHIINHTMWKLLNNSDFFWLLSSIDISKDNLNIDKTYSINIKEYIKRGNGSEKTKTRKRPTFMVRNIKIDKNKILGQLDIDLGLFPYISNRTIFTFRNFSRLFSLKTENKLLSTLRIDFIDMREFIRVNFEIEILSLQDLVSSIRYLRHPLYFTEAQSTGFFKGLVVKFDGDYLLFYAEKNYFLIYEKKLEKGYSFFKANFSHSIDSFEDVALICSSCNFEENETEFSNPFVHLILPRLNFKISGHFFESRITIIEGEYIFYQDNCMKGIFRSEVEITFNDELRNITKLENLISSEYLVNITDELKYLYIHSEYPKNEQSSFSVCFKPEKMEITLLDILDINPFKFGVNIKQPLGYSLPCFYNFYIENKINITKGPFLRLLFSGAEFVDDRHISLHEDVEISLVIIDKNLYLGISDCSLEISLFSIQELRILVMDFFKFGQCSNALGHILSLILNESLNKEGTQGDIKDLVCCVNANVNHTGFGDKAISKIRCELGFDNEILSSSKFGKINFKPLKILYKTDNSLDDLAYLEIGTKVEKNIKYLTFYAEIYKKLLTVKGPCSLVVNYNSPIVTPVKKEVLLKTIRSFFVALWVKDKPNNDEKSVLTNLSIDASDTEFVISPVLQSSEIKFAVENYGFRDFIRYKLANIFFKMFTKAPRKLNLNLAAENLDIFSFEFLKNTSRKSIDILVKNVKCSQSFVLVDETQKIKDTDKFKNLDGINFFNGEKSTGSECSQDNICNLLYGNNNKYSLNLTFNMILSDHGEKEIPIRNVKCYYDFFDSLYELIKDDTTVKDANVKTNHILFDVSALKIFIGFNYRIRCPKNLKLIGKCKDLNICSIDLRDQKGLDGYLTCNFRNALKLLFTGSNIKVLLLEKDNFDISLKQKEILVQYTFDFRGLIYKYFGNFSGFFIEKCQNRMDYLGKLIEKGLNFFKKSGDKPCDNESCNQQRIMILS